MQAAGTSYSWIKDTMYCDGSMKESVVISILISTPNSANLNVIVNQYYIFRICLEREVRYGIQCKKYFIGLSASHKKVDIVRAVIEGVSMNLKWILESLEESLPIR